PHAPSESVRGICSGAAAPAVIEQHPDPTSRSAAVRPAVAAANRYEPVGLRQDAQAAGGADGRSYSERYSRLRRPVRSGAPRAKPLLDGPTSAPLRLGETCTSAGSARSSTRTAGGAPTHRGGADTLTPGGSRLLPPVCSPFSCFCAR